MNLNINTIFINIMCGIWALLTTESFNNYEFINATRSGSNCKNKEFYESFFDESKFSSFFNKSSPRGPNYSTFNKISPQVYLGFHRLNIINDSSMSNQPLIYSDNKRDVYLLCNGEIYNHDDIFTKLEYYFMNSMLNTKELNDYIIKLNTLKLKYVTVNNIFKNDKLSDCEILLDLYINFEQEFSSGRLFNKINGEYAYILVDINKINKSIKVFYGRDRYGIRPLYVYKTKTLICLSSEIKSNIGLYYINKSKSINNNQLYDKNYDKTLININDRSNLTNNNSFYYDLFNNICNGKLENVVPNYIHHFNLKVINNLKKDIMIITHDDEFINTVDQHINSKCISNYNNNLIFIDVSLPENIINYEQSILLTENISKSIYEENKYNNSLIYYMSQINISFYDAIKRRLNTNKKVGCLLSGGLDSSLVAAIAAQILREKKESLYTFSIGRQGSEDLKCAKIVSEFIGSIHTEVELKFDDNEFIEDINNIIYITETYDVTTIRASLPQYKLCKYISKHTDIKILLIGDGSDELTGGYKYFRNAPNIYEIFKETSKLLSNISYFDVKRADSTISSNGLEARVPFLDTEFVDVYRNIPKDYLFPTQHLYNPSFNPVKRLSMKKENVTSFFNIYNSVYINYVDRFKDNNVNTDSYTLYDYNSTNISKILTKQLLRDSFWEITRQFLHIPNHLKNKLLPDEILFRSKEAFSDGVSKKRAEIKELLWYEEIQNVICNHVYNHNNCYGNIEKKTLYNNKLEQSYYLYVYNRFFGNIDYLPYRWLPNWCDNESNPSATVLKSYKECEMETYI
jgi:asparagine synthetase B (glutamine-hydrolysing)